MNLNMGSWLEVAIGLAALYFLLATACSTILEGVHSCVGIRGRALTKFVQEMLTGQPMPMPDSERALPADAASGPLSGAGWLLQHPLIRSLSKPSVRAQNGDTMPSYIPASAVSQAMLSTLVQQLGALSVVLEPQLRESLLARLQGDSTWKTWLERAGTSGASVWSLMKELLGHDAVGPNEWNLIAQQLTEWQSKLDAHGLKTVLYHAAQEASTLSSAQQQLTPQDALQAWVAGIGKRLPVAELSYEVLQGIVSSGALSPALQRSLQSILDVANYDIDKVRLGIERWYDAVMDRASGWFKRHSIFWLFFMGLVAAVSMNLDSLQIGRQLIDKPALRQRAATLGESMVRTAPEKMAVVTQQTVFVNWVKQEKLDEGKAAVSKEDARMALGMLLRSAEMSGPLFEMEMAWRSNDKDPRKNILTRLAALACRGRLARTPTDLMSDDLRKVAALSTEEVLQSEYCGEERSAVQARTESAPAAPASAPFAPAASKTAFKVDISDPDVAACRLLGLPSVSWNARAAQLSWGTIIAETEVQGCKTSGSEDLRQAYKTAAAGTEQLVNDLREAYTLLENVGPIWKLYDRIWDISKCGCSLAGHVFTSMLGWLLTAVMVSFGAPFWFDLLSKLVDRRAAGPKTESS